MDRRRRFVKFVPGPTLANLIRFAIAIRGRTPFKTKDLYDDFIKWGLSPPDLRAFRSFFYQHVTTYKHARRITDKIPYTYEATPQFWACLYPHREDLIAFGPDYRRDIERAFYENHVKPNRVKI